MSLLLPIIIGAQIIFSAFVLEISSPNIVPLKNHVKNVLGVKIAQDIAPTDSTPSTTPEPQPLSSTEPAPETSPATSPAPSETTTQANSTDQPEANPQPQQETTPSFPDQSQPQGTNPTSGNSTADTQQQINSLNQIFEIEPASPSPSSQPESSQEQQSTISQNMAVLNPEELTNSSESINPQAVAEVKKEEDSLSKITDPGKQTEQLIINSVDKIKDINQEIIKDDFASTNFASQRFNDQIDRALENINSLPKAQAQKLQVQLTKLCNQADLILRNAELAVPEDLEQDLEINRGRCL